MVVAFAYVVQIAISGIGVIGFVPTTSTKASGGGATVTASEYQNCGGAGATTRDVFPIANKNGDQTPTSDKDTFVCALPALIENNFYLWAQAIEQNALSAQSFTVALLLVAARLYVRKA
jgi:hypothetical protein